jgi:hypothetical protein
MHYGDTADAPGSAQLSERAREPGEPQPRASDGSVWQRVTQHCGEACSVDGPSG